MTPCRHTRERVRPSSPLSSSTTSSATGISTRCQRRGNNGIIAAAPSSAALGTALRIPLQGPPWSFESRGGALHKTALSISSITSSATGISTLCQRRGNNGNIAAAPYAIQNIAKTVVVNTTTPQSCTTSLGFSPGLLLYISWRSQSPRPRAKSAAISIERGIDAAAQKPSKKRRRK